MCSEVPWTRVFLVRPFIFDDAGQVNKFGKRIASGNDRKSYLTSMITSLISPCPPSMGLNCYRWPEEGQSSLKGWFSYSNRYAASKSYMTTCVFEFRDFRTARPEKRQGSKPNAVMRTSQPSLVISSLNVLQATFEAAFWQFSDNISLDLLQDRSGTFFHWHVFQSFAVVAEGKRLAL
jgi:hypothetical protein